MARDIGSGVLFVDHATVAGGWAPFSQKQHLTRLRRRAPSILHEMT
ncbi:hypothetical protein [Ottowia testudinis]|uniref:Uncharacterized protein n=1 Tax=Ottowia testudinis TaxID=2816950 RepID=A0A975CGN9_9BURK|nr:hypothetical protein [Ottowia testudinis]QTD45865.1 hypothetical protein J1M35_02800 [Ottowia testudinis]